MMQENKMTRRFIMIKVGICAVLILRLVACGSSGTNALKGTTWQLDFLAGSDLLPGTRITIEFVEDEVSGSAGCNHYGASYQTSGNSLSFNEIFATEMACPEPAGVLEQESIYLTVLGTADSYQIAGDRLEVFDEAGVQILVFVASTVEALSDEQMSTSATPELSLDCTLKMDDSFPVGEPVRLGFELLNHTERQLYVLSWYTPLEGIAGDIFQVTRDGEKLPYQGLQAKRGDPVWDDYIAVEPGELTSAEVDLRLGYDLSTPGSYQVQFTTGLWDATDDSSSVPRKRDDHQPRPLACNTVSFHIEPSPEPPTAAPTKVPSTATPTPELPAGFKPYQDSVVGISVHIPESWVVTQVFVGESAILQSYPEGKYIGGEGRQPGDTKCDLTIRPSDVSLEAHMDALRSNPGLTVMSEEEIILRSGETGVRVEVESMGPSISLITEVNQRVVVLTCFGELAPFDDIAATIDAIQ